MHNRSFRTAFLVTFAGIIVIGVALSSSVMARGKGERFSGAFFVEFVVPGTPIVLPSVATIHKDGTGMSVDATDGGLGPGFNAPLFFVNTVSQGNWKRTGKRTIITKSVFFNFLKPDDTSNPDNLHGILASISKLTTVVHYDKRYETIHGQVCEQMAFVDGGFYNPGEDNPLDLPEIDCTPESIGAFLFTGRRIR